MVDATDLVWSFYLNESGGSNAHKKRKGKMAAVVEIGSYRIRGGYSGDTNCTVVAPAVSLRRVDSSSSTLPTLSHVLRAGCPVEPIWALGDLLHNETSRSLEFLSQLVKHSLGLVNSPLAIVLPEIWHERRELVTLLTTAILESGVASSLAFFRPSVCWSLSCGKPSAIVLDCGHSHTTAASVADAYVLRKSLFTNEKGGRAVSAALGKALSCASHQFGASFADEQLLDSIKRSATCVSIPGGSTGSTNPALFAAPDGNQIVVPPDCRSAAYEVLFSSHGEHVAQQVAHCSRVTDVEQRSAQAVIACGGTSRAQGFGQRLLYELKKIDSTFFTQSAVHAAPDEHGAWRGASLITSSSAFGSLWITPAEFAEEGESVLSRKLFQ